MTSGLEPGTETGKQAGKRLAGWVPDLAAGLLPVLVLFALGGASVLDPTALGWARRGDTSSHLVGWLFFLREPWAASAARIESWLVPVGTTIGFADAIPLLALPLKAIARSMATHFPPFPPFQYFGLWFGACLAAQGLLAARLLRELAAGSWLRALGGGMVGLSPVVWERFARGHVSLAAQCLILAAFLAWFRHLRRGGGRRSLLAFAALPIVAAAIHPYLTLILGGLLAGLVVASGLRFGRRAALEAALALVLSGGLSVAVARVSGFLGSGERLETGPWGGFSLDAGAWFNSDGWSRWVPTLFGGGDHREGFVYLGTGFLLLALVVLAHRARAREPTAPRAGALVTDRGEGDLSRAGLTAICVLLALLALLPQIELFGWHLVGAPRITGLLEPFLGPFRANGRLAWPLHLWILVSLLAALRPLEIRRGALVGLLVLAFGLQASEIPAETVPRAAPLFGPGERETWRELRAAGYARLEMVPPFWKDGGAILCGDLHGSDDWVVPAALAAESGMTFDSGYVARLPAALLRAECARRESALEEGRFRDDTLYLVRPRLARRLGRGRLDCERFSRSLYLCSSGARPAAASGPAG